MTLHQDDAYLVERFKEFEKDFKCVFILSDKSLKNIEIVPLPTVHEEVDEEELFKHNSDWWGFKILAKCESGILGQHKTFGKYTMSKQRPVYLSLTATDNSGASFATNERFQLEYCYFIKDLVRYGMTDTEKNEISTTLKNNNHESLFYV